MKIFHTVRKSPEPASVALGYFDGVHKGHQRVIKNAVKSEKYGLKSVVFTFSERPDSLLRGIKEEKISGVRRRMELFQEMGVSEVYCVDFLEISNLSGEEFVNKILFDNLNARHVSCGFNYTFGCGGVSSASDLKKLCGRFNISVNISEPVLYGTCPVSSTRIRCAIKEGRKEDVLNMLGRNHI